MARNLSILSLIVLALTLAPTSNARGRGKLRNSEGTYTLKIAGYVAGQGNADVSSDTGVKLTLHVAEAQGGRGEKVEVNLPLKGNRFGGTGNILGTPATFQGRLDVPDDSKERALRGVRMICHITSNNRYARVIGFIPELATARDRIDNGEDVGAPGRGISGR